jgi:hypothetical protein
MSAAHRPTCSGFRSPAPSAGSRRPITHAGHKHPAPTCRPRVRWTPEMRQRVSFTPQNRPRIGWTPSAGNRQAMPAA